MLSGITTTLSAEVEMLAAVNIDIKVNPNKKSKRRRIICFMFYNHSDNKALKTMSFEFRILQKYRDYYQNS